MESTSKDQIVIRGELVEAFGEGPVVYETAGLVDDDECEYTPEADC